MDHWKPRMWNVLFGPLCSLVFIGGFQPRITGAQCFAWIDAGIIHAQKQPEKSQSSQHSFKGLFSEQLKTPNTLSWKTKQWCHDSEWRIRIEKSQVWKSTLGRERQNRNSDLKLKHHIPTKKKKSFFKEGVNHHLVQKRAAQCSHLWGRLDSNSDFNTREEEEIKYQEKAPMKWYYRAESCFGSQCSSHEHVGRKNF